MLAAGSMIDLAVARHCVPPLRNADSKKASEPPPQREEILREGELCWQKIGEGY